VPSVVTYGSSGDVSSWGFILDPDQYHVSQFKLLLSEEGVKFLEQKQPERFRELQDLLTRYKKTPLDVSADYLRLLWTHAMKHIQKRIGDIIWEVVKFKIVLTVPAVWDHKAQDLTRQAAKRAGFLDRKDTILDLIGEPEAAALAVFAGAYERGPPLPSEFVVNN
jgi:molecular chaperone DnaK (HSP70)